MSTIEHLIKNTGYAGIVSYASVLSEKEFIYTMASRICFAETDVNADFENFLLTFRLSMHA